MTTIEKLLVLQDRDRKIRQLTQETTDIPARKQLIEQRLKNHRDAVHSGHEELKRNAADIRANELEVETRKQKILKLREQQGAVKTNEQYRAIENEVATLGQQIRVYEDKEIELMEAAEAIKARVGEVETLLKREESGVHEDRRTLDERLKNILTDIEQVKQERAKLLPDIDETWLARYERIFQHKGDFAIVPVENGSCGGCHMRLPPQQVHDAKRAQTMVACSFCGRLLYHLSY